MLTAVALLYACNREPDRGNLSAAEAPSAQTAAEKAPGGWTHERIAADPVGYIDWAQTELDRLESKLKGHRLSAQVIDNKLKRESGADEALAASRAKQLNEMVALYKNHAASQQWPATYHGVPVDQDTLKRLILQTSASIDAEKGRANLAPQAGKRVAKQEADIEEKLAQIKAQRGKLAEARRMVALNRDISKLNELMGATNELLDTSDAAALFGKVEVKAEDFMPTARDATDDTRFNQILNP